MGQLDQTVYKIIETDVQVILGRVIDLPTTNQSQINEIIDAGFDIFSLTRVMRFSMNQAFEHHDPSVDIGLVLLNEIELAKSFFPNVTLDTDNINSGMIVSGDERLHGVFGLLLGNVLMSNEYGPLTATIYDSSLDESVLVEISPSEGGLTEPSITNRLDTNHVRQTDSDDLSRGLKVAEWMLDELGGRLFVDSNDEKELTIIVRLEKAY